MVRQQLDAVLEWTIFIILLGILCFGPLATGAVRVQDFLIIQGATVLLVVLWAVRCWAAENVRLLWPPICWAVIAFVAYAIARYSTAEVEYVARQELIRIMVYACIFFVTLNNVTQREPVQWLSLALVLLAAGIAVYAIYQWGTKSDRVWNFIRPASYAGRGSGTYICPNHLAGFLEIILPIGLAYTVAGRGSTLFKLAIGYASLIIFAGIAVTLSVGGWAATAVSLALFGILKLQNRNYRRPAIALLAVLAAVGVFIVGKADVDVHRIEKSKVLNEYGSATVRLEMWSAAYAMWRDHPLWGVGPAHFDERFPAYRPVSRVLQARPERVHNDWLNTLVDWGLVGFILVISAWVLVFWGVVRVWKYVQRPVGDLAKQTEGRSTSQSNRAAFVVGATVGLVALLLHSFFDFNLHIPANAILAVALMALLSSHWRFATERWWCSRRVTLAFVTSLALLGALALGAAGGRQFLETRWLLRADRASEGSKARLEALQQAANIEPNNEDSALRIGEHLRLLSWEGDDGYQNLARQAIEWFERAALLNRFDSYAALRHGMCLVWLGQLPEAAPFFEEASRLDPNSYYTLALRGWYQFQLGHYPEAKQLFERSIYLDPNVGEKSMPQTYLNLLERRLKEPPSLLNRR